MVETGREVMVRVEMVETGREVLVGDTIKANTNIDVCIYKSIKIGACKFVHMYSYKCTNVKQCPQTLYQNPVIKKHHRKRSNAK